MYKTANNKYRKTYINFILFDRWIVGSHRRASRSPNSPRAPYTQGRAMSLRSTQLENTAQLSSPAKYRSNLNIIPRNYGEIFYGEQIEQFITGWESLLSDKVLRKLTILLATLRGGVVAPSALNFNA